MKNWIKILSASMLLMTSCEKVIELDVNDAESQYVVEALLSDDPTERATARISKSVNVDQSNTYPSVRNATVVLTNLTNNERDTLREGATAGLYVGSRLFGRVGQTYELTISVDGRTFTARSSMPQKVNLDSVRTIRQTVFGNTRFATIPVFTDPVGKGNAYRFVLGINQKMSETLYVLSDDLSDGNVNGRPLSGPNGPDTLSYKSGDTIRLEMQCIDPKVYKYFESLLEGGGAQNSSSASPANPVTNFSGGALGYFGAFTRQKRTFLYR